MSHQLTDDSESVFSTEVRHGVLESMRALRNPLMADSVAAEQLLRQADAVLDDVAAAMRDGGGQGTGWQTTELSDEIAMSRASQRVPPTESLRTAIAMFEILLPAVVDAARERRMDEQALMDAVASLHESILRRLGQGAMSYAGFLLTKVNNANRDERRRIARELHDQAAHAVGVALQDLELHDVYVDEDTTRARNRIASARTALNEAITVVRHLAQELRESPAEVGSLERALADYLTWRVPPEIRTKLSVADDIDAPNQACEELYFVLREAIRNAVVHAEAQQLEVLVALADGDIHATVRDDGRGFDVDAVAASAAGVGLSSMRERLELLAGTLEIISVPGKGTTISIRIAHPGQTA
ncbi:sensor histidine kinase [Actinophytocola sp.]|jgi:signal transduction histidine kinase|uniref:sensor histidine kinase n=1 Tax=Actinophytocola sp. TaxID=1872138 RepID=UPI002ED7AEF2